MQLREIMTHEVEVIDPDATLEAASEKMTASNISALPVCDGRQLVGILTERDLIGRATAETRDLQTTRVREVMTTDLLSCFEDQESTEALRLIQERQIGYLAVLSHDQRFVGIVSLRNVAKPQREEELVGSAIRSSAAAASPWFHYAGAAKASMERDSTNPPFYSRRQISYRWGRTQGNISN